VQVEPTKFGHRRLIYVIRSALQDDLPPAVIHK